MIDRFVIYLLIGGCLIFGALVLLELRPAATDTATPNEVPIRPDPSAMHRQPSTQLDKLLAEALARPLFSSTRRPPQAAANDSADSDLADMRLTGIVTKPEHHLAIFAVNGAAKPLRLTEGEDVSGWRIESITPHEVSLSGPGGTKTLQPKLDPNLVQKPPPQPAPNVAARPRLLGLICRRDQRFRLAFRDRSRGGHSNELASRAYIPAGIISARSKPDRPLQCGTRRRRGSAGPPAARRFEAMFKIKQQMEREDGSGLTMAFMPEKASPKD